MGEKHKQKPIAKTIQKVDWFFYSAIKFDSIVLGGTTSEEIGIKLGSKENPEAFPHNQRLYQNPWISKILRRSILQDVSPNTILLSSTFMKTKTRKELLDDMKFQEMKRFLGIQRVRNYCSGCGDEIHEPVYCDSCTEEINKIRLRNSPR